MPDKTITTNYGEENTGMSAALNMSAEGAASPPQTTELLGCIMKFYMADTKHEILMAQTEAKRILIKYDWQRERVKYD